MVFQVSVTAREKGSGDLMIPLMCCLMAALISEEDKAGLILVKMLRGQDYTLSIA